MDSNVIKFPYSVSRRVHSRKPRRSKNGTPEERADKKYVQETGDSSLVLFVQHLKAYVIRRLVEGQAVEAVFEDLEESYRRLAPAGQA